MTAPVTVAGFAIITWLGLRFADRIFTGFAPVPASGGERWLLGLGFLVASIGLMGLLIWMPLRFPKGGGASPSPERDIPTIVPTVLSLLLVVGGGLWLAGSLLIRRKHRRRVG